MSPRTRIWICSSSDCVAGAYLDGIAWQDFLASHIVTLRNIARKMTVNAPASMESKKEPHIVSDVVCQRHVNGLQRQGEIGDVELELQLRGMLRSR